MGGDEPTVTVEAAYSKHRREDVLPLKKATAAVLGEYLRLRLPSAPAFPMPLADGAGADMIEADMTAARAAWLKEVEGDAKTREAREKTFFLKRADAVGHMADFHALRHTLATRLMEAGVNPKVIQSIMRHSTITLTMDRYTHLSAARLSDALDALPDLDAVPKAAEMRATGTDDAPTVVLNPPPETDRDQLTGVLTEIEAERGVSCPSVALDSDAESTGAENEKAPESRENPDDSEALSMVGAEGFEPTTRGLRIRKPLFRNGHATQALRSASAFRVSTYCPLHNAESRSTASRSFAGNDLA